MVILGLWSEGPDGEESFTVVDVVQNRGTPTTVNLAYTSAGYTVDGHVKDSSTGDGIFFASVLLYKQPGDIFAGFAETDRDGKYTFYNVPEGDVGITYRLAVTHPDYPDDTEWSSGFRVDADVTVDDILMGGGTLVADFGSDGIGADGIWANDGTSWTKIANSDPENLMVWGSDLVADFGSDGIGADGIYVYDGAWTKIGKSDPESLVVW